MFDFLQFEFMRSALIAGMLVSLICPLLGVFLIVRRYTLISDTLAHSSLTGVILGLISGINPLISTLLYSISSAFVIEKLRLSKRVSGDMVLALFLALNMGLVSLALSLNSRTMMNIGSYLFGSISLVRTQDLYILFGVFFVVLTVFFILKRPLMMTTYDEEAAQVSGVNTKRINMIFMLTVGMVVAVSFPITGILLLSSLLILPVIAASQIAKSFSGTLIIAEILSFVSVISGIITSYYLGVGASGVIALLLVFFFFVMFGIGSFKK